jgi:hypothetical protein
VVLGRDPGIADVHPRPSENASEYSRFRSVVSRERFRGLVNLLRGLSSSPLVCHPHGMSLPSTNSSKHHRCPAEIISHGVWLYVRCCLSYRDVEELLLARGVIVTDAAIRQWCLQFGPSCANPLRRRRPRPGDK